MNRLLRTLSLVILFSSITSCTVNPVTGQQQFSLISPDQEVVIGAQQYQSAQQSQGGQYYMDPELQTYLDEVGQKLARVSDRPQLPYEFVVLNSSVPNAWALPGGKIAVNRGLLFHLEDEAQLAAVLSHEIVHAAARHSATQMTRGMLAGIGLQVLDTATGGSPLGGLAAQVGTSAWMSRYGREAELESDAYGMEYMARAGYDPYGAVVLQEKFVELSKDRQQDFLAGLFASHPPSQGRVNANVAKAKTLPPGGLRNREIFARKVARLKRDQPAYEAQDKAMKALQDKAPKEALSLLDEAIRIQPREGQFWELRGHAWKMLGDDSKAIEAYSAAISRNPDFFSHHLARGIQYFQQGKSNSAHSDLLRSHQLLPTPIASLYLGDIAAARGERQTAITYYQEAANAPGDIGQQARTRLAELQLSEAPSKYIRSSLALGAGGMLQLSVQNQSATAVDGVVVQISEAIATLFNGPASFVEVPVTLRAGQQITLSTHIGPLDGSALRRYRAVVVKAAPVAPKTPLVAPKTQAS